MLWLMFDVGLMYHMSTWIMILFLLASINLMMVFLFHAGSSEDENLSLDC